MQTVAIVGVGLIGGSFGLALRKAGFQGRIIGVSSEKTIAAAVERNAVDGGASLADAAAQADLIYLAHPIGRILDALYRLDPLVNPNALITDAGSTKLAIVATAETTIVHCRFLGGHPMAGKEQRGVEAADADLFVNRTYVLTPEEPEDLERPAEREFVKWLQKIGAKPLVLDAAEHDRIVALTSHLPQLLSTALAAMVSERAGEHLAVAGPGLTDMSRLALSSYDLWRDILATNQNAIEHALTCYISKLEHVRDNLRNRAVQEEFERAADLARRLRR